MNGVVFVRWNALQVEEHALCHGYTFRPPIQKWLSVAAPVVNYSGEQAASTASEVQRWPP